MTKRKIFTFHFKSGNSCEVIIGAKGFEIGGVNHINPQWEVSPPSRKDQVEWERVCLPGLCKELRDLGLLKGDLGILDLGFQDGESQLDAFCTSGDSPGEEGNNDR